MESMKTMLTEMSALHVKSFLEGNSILNNVKSLNNVVQTLLSNVQEAINVSKLIVLFKT